MSNAAADLIESTYAVVAKTTVVAYFILKLGYDCAGSGMQTIHGE